MSTSTTHLHAVPTDTTDEERLRALYAQHRGAVFAMVLAETSGSRAVAEDVVQETLLRAWRNIGKLDFDRPLRPWLMAVARRILIDGYRSRQIRPFEVIAEENELPSTPDLVDRSMSALVVEEAIGSLSAMHREVIVEVYFHDQTLSDVAERLGVPPGTVRSRVFYAQQALRRELMSRGITGAAA